MARYSWIDVALWIVAVVLLIPFVLQTVGVLVEALELLP
jgi:hypothetical protein